jgi:quercetin dioxygenase-like cupin family protein
MTTEADFRAGLEQDGYAISESSRAAGTVNKMHSHAFAARLLCTGGSLEVVTADGASVYGPGDVCVMAAGTMHEERIGPDGVALVVGRKA